MKVAVVFVLALGLHSIDAFLKVQNNALYYNNDKVFLSGANIAWYNYGWDFGSGAYSNVKTNYQQALDEISQAGGNSIRVWVHIDGQWSPKFDSEGYATGSDTDSLISDLGELLDYAEQKNVFVILCLWNLAVAPTKMLPLYTDDAKLQSYLEKVLKPMAAGLKDKKALAAWDIINEPIGSLTQGLTDSNPCYDTNNLINSGADWTNVHLKPKDVLKFINLHADAIKSADPKALVTVGESSELTATTICEKCRDMYSDSCLVGAGGKALGTIDFYQLHSYTWNGAFSTSSPFKNAAAAFKSDKPIVVGEFATCCSELQDSAKNYQYLYNSGFSGALSWQYNEGGNCADPKSVIDQGMSAIKDYTYNGNVHVTL
uniref:Glycoside hydrolase family protein 5 n=1 Tax=Gastrophysa viridula TaxID=154015 RepID=E7CIX1_GASVI|nr:glycoside hydrolase family protein 5 [Gastrophysa viridula]